MFDRLLVDDVGYSPFESKLLYLTELIGEMTYLLPKRRPNCKKILDDKSKWTLGRNDFEVMKNDFIETLDLKSNHKESFVLTFLKKKLSTVA